MNKFLTNLLRFILFLSFQILVFNRIHWLGFLNPQVYLLALLLLPLEIPKIAQYIIAFFTGLIIDIFLNSFGIHAAACLIMIFIRPYFILILNGFKPIDTILKPTPSGKDFNWLLMYILGLSFVHQIIVTSIETFNISDWFIIIWTSIANTIFTTFIIMCLEYLFFSKKNNQ